MLSCQNTKKNPTESKLSDDSTYDGRVANIFKYIQAAGISINTDTCHKIIVLQTNLCNSCSKEGRQALFGSLIGKKGQVLVILAEESPDIELQIKQLSPNALIYVDTLKLLSKYNLSFLKNLEIYNCNNQVVRWAFV